MASDPQLEFRSPHAGEALAFFTPVLQSFGDQPNRLEIDRQRATWEPERSFGALDGDRWVGVSGAFSQRMTLPGGAEVPVSGITMIGVAPTHRRRGVLTTMMSWLLDDAVERGEAVAVLTASESKIYGRFGFGVATHVASQEIDSAHARFREPVALGGRFTMLQPGEAAGVLHALWDRNRLQRFGEMSRPKSRWDDEMLDLEQRRHGLSALFVVVHEGHDGPDGFVTYRQKNLWGIETHRLPGTQLIVDDLLGATPEIEAGLWQFVSEVDLVKSVVLPVRPVDDPMRWRLVEPRQFKVTSVSDWTWVRVLDVPAALSARQYRADGSLVLELVDPYRPTAGGRFRIESSGGNATCAATPDASPDLTLGPAELGALYLGGVAPSVLSAAGRIDEHTPGALARADLLLPINPGPFTGTMF